MFANNEIGTYGSPVTLKAKLASGSAGQSLANLGIVFKVDGIEVGTSQTDAGGNAWFKFTGMPNVGYLFGSHKIESSFAGNSALNKASAEATLGIIKATTKVEGSQIGMMVYAVPGSATATTSEIYVQGKLVREPDSAPIEGRSVDIMLNGAVIGNTATSNSGNFSFKAPFTKGPGKYTLQSVFGSDTHYVGTASEKKDLDIGAPLVMKGFASSPTVQPAMPVYFVGQQITLSSKVSMLSGGYGAGIPGVTVWIRPDGNVPVFKVVTNAAGVASASFKLLKSGTRELGAEIRDEKYLDGNPSPIYSTVSVLPAPLTVKVDGPASGKIGDMVDLKISLTNYAHTDDVLPAGYSLTILGVPVFTGTTNKISIPSNLGIGNKAIKVVYSGGDSYAPSEGIWNINIQAKDN